MAKKSDRPFIDRIVNVVPSKDPQNDWDVRVAVASRELTAPAALPAQVDLREPWWKIGNQQSTGACVGWATADALVRWHMVQAGRLQQDEKLAARFVWMAAKETDTFNDRPTSFIEREGTSLKAALDVVRKFGVVRDSELPFTGGRLYPKDAKTFYARAAEFKIRSYFNLGATLRNWRTWIASNGPILVALQVDEVWDNASATSGALAVYDPSTTRGGHAAALVGYTPTGFIVRNSWGTTWGDGGFGYATDAYAAAAFGEAYGIVV